MATTMPRIGDDGGRRFGRRPSPSPFPFPPRSTLLLSLSILFPALIAAASVDAQGDDSSPSGTGGGGGKCGLYLAPSSTNPVDEDDDDGGAAGGNHIPVPPELGLYAGREYSPHEIIGHPEIAVQMYDMEGHTGRSILTSAETGRDEDEDEMEAAEGEDGHHRPPPVLVKPEHVNYFHFAVTQFWTPDSTGAMYDTSQFWSETGDGGHGRGGHTYTAIPGVGMLCNFHPGIINADWNQRTCHERIPERDAESANASRDGRDHPGRGAHSDYYNVTIRATKTIPAGMEIFMDYGGEWAEENSEKDDATAEDYERADKSIDAILTFMDRYDDRLSPELSSEIYDFLINDVVPLGSESEERSEIQRSLLPKTASKLKAVRDTGGALRHRNPSVFRDVRWLEENGQCMDNIYPGPSTVPYAGRGAFAARPIAEGHLVSPMPLVHIPHRRELDMYDLEEVINTHTDETVLVRSSDGNDDGDGASAEPTGKQLLLNYCFGHPESNVLLYPFGTASNFINHMPGDRANAKIVWSSSSSEGGGGLKIHRPEWLKLSPSRLNDPEYSHVGLAFDVVATRDIRKGEEVFLDYGTEWGKAWDEHVQKFQEEEEEERAGGEEDKHVDPTALELEALYHGRTAESGGTLIPFPTPRELRRRQEEGGGGASSSSYPDRVTTACHVSYREIMESDDDDDDDEGGGIKTFEGYKVYQWTDVPFNDDDDDDDDEEVGGGGGSVGDVWKGASMRLCEIVARTPLYRAKADDEEEKEEEAIVASYEYVAKVILEEDSDGTTETKVVRGVPHGAVRFVDRPYRGDQHKVGAFRREIGIPDDIFPQAWRDRKKE